MKKSTRKLASRKLKLRAEIVRTLGTLDLARAVGGVASVATCSALLLAESGNINCPAPAVLAATACA